MGMFQAPIIQVPLREVLGWIYMAGSKPVTVSMAGRISKVDNDLFKGLSNS